MDFNKAISVIADVLSATGTNIDISQYDGVIVKKLEASNTLDDGRSTNQTHIAITGAQMDIFPYIRADGYFNETVSDAELKKYFIPQIPVCIHKSNCEYLGNDSADGLLFTKDTIEGKTSVVRSKRKKQADQIQVSLINFDSQDFVAFRRLLHAGSFLILMKRAKQFKYDVFGIIPGKGIDADGGLQQLNNQFFKLATNTVVDAFMNVDGAENTITNNEDAFKKWFARQLKENGEPYSDNTRNQYIGALKAVATAFGEAIAPLSTVFEIDDHEVFERVSNAVKNAPNFEDFNKSRGNGSLSAALDMYARFLDEKDAINGNICFNTGYQCGYARNRILFGAPGTGKSYTINKDKDALLSKGGEYERVTFHPDYSYASFVGTYKPVPCVDKEGKDAITYAYVPGPFMRTYVKALLNSRTDSPKPYLLIIEEINRANVAAVFGDVFQLLDRGADEVSEYPIQASEDVKKYLADALKCKPEECAEIRIPDNMFIWATMNSADQGVFPLDTAFKRRWDFTYLGIDDSEDGIAGKTVVLGQGEYRRCIEWNELRKAINEELLSYKVNEDKLMGPYFLSKKIIPEGAEIDQQIFTSVFKNKVLMYLFDDAAKQKRSSLFAGCDDKTRSQYSKICREFDKKGVYIFCDGISSQFIDNLPEDDE